MPDLPYFDQLREEDTPAALSEEREVNVAPYEDGMYDLRSEIGLPEDLSGEIEEGLEALYGSAFPFLQSEEPGEDDWVAWAEDLWERHGGAVTSRLHLVERNRLFRKGVQWISSVGNSGWREPPKPRDAARIVHNMIRPALDQRVQIISEQRPGFKTRPTTQDPDDLRKAEAQQCALEYQYDSQDMTAITKEAAYWSGTDGTVFLEIYWDPDAGPWHEMFYTDPMSGQQIPMDQSGNPVMGGQPHRMPLGDIRTKVRRLEQVRVSADASATCKPWYWVIKDEMALAKAVREYGLDVAKTKMQGNDDDEALTMRPAARHGYLLPDELEGLKDQETVSRYTVYCERSEYLPEGLHLVVVGDLVVANGPLMYGMIPMLRWTDGSTDPSWYVTPVMDDWLDNQMRINAILSKWVENVRLNATPKLLSKAQSVSRETLVGSTMTLIEARGLGSLSDIVRPLEGMSLAPDAKELLDREIKAFEDKTGWNDTSRGSFSSEQSGRAILAIREQLERIFAPCVMAAANAMTTWAKINMAMMKWGYDIPRIVGVQGKGRPDLVRELTSEDFDGAIDVEIDAETLMPLPRALRLQLLDDMFQKGLMPPDEYRRRMPFAWVRDMEFPEEAHTIRARRVSEAIRQGQWLPILWMDNEHIHKQILEREILLQDDVDQNVRGMAFERWMQLSQQEQMKAMGIMPGGAPPAMPPMGPPAGGAAPPGNPVQPQTQPFAGTSPGVSAGTFSSMGGQTDQNDAARRFDQRMQQQGSA